MNRLQAEAILKFIPFLAIWIAFMALKLVVAALGLIVIPILWRYRMVEYDKLPKVFRPWANPEDHHGGSMYKRGRSHNSLPDWWIDQKGISLKSFWLYHAIRNPANGLRSFEFLDLDIVMERVKFVATEYFKHYEPGRLRKDGKRWAAYLAWQGWQAGCKVVIVWNDERHLVLKLGWRIQPSDAVDLIDPAGIRHEDSGFASKFLPYRKG